MTDYPASLGVVLHVVDLLEVLGVVAATGAALDRAHLLRWAIELGVADLLERAIGEVERT